MHFSCIQKPRSLIPHHLQHACRNRMQFFLSFLWTEVREHTQRQQQGLCVALSAVPHYEMCSFTQCNVWMKNEGWIFYAKNYFNSFTEILRDVEWKLRVFLCCIWAEFDRCLNWFCAKEKLIERKFLNIFESSDGVILVIFWWIFKILS